ncbi:MAG: histidine kinase [Bacteroidales bacterium]|nr:histidine kinase [Bacteroidales bacterium]
MNIFMQAYHRKMGMLRDIREAMGKLGEVNPLPAFRTYRERYLELILAVLSSFAIMDIVLGQVADYATGNPRAALVLPFRIILLAILTLNFSVYLYRPEKLRTRWFIYPLFYTFTLFSPVITWYTGGLESSYRFEIIFILVTWFMLIPFSYRTLILHALILATLYSVLMFSIFRVPLEVATVIEHSALFLALFLLGSLVAIFNNIFSASVYLSEQRIAKSEERFRMFTQNSLDVVWTMDMKSGCFTYMSPSVYNLRGYRPEELIGQPVEESLTPESQEKVRALLEEARNEIRSGNMKKVVIGELEQYTKSGETVWIEVIVSFVTDDKGEITELIGDSRNITERKKAESELLRIQEQLKEKSEKLQQENLRIQYESLKNQINPHFLFNSLNVLTSLIRIDAGLAEKFTEQMAKVYRYVLEHKEEDVVTLRTEMEFIRSYLFLLEIRFEGKILIDTDIPEAALEKQVPPLTVQLLIENAVKHNVFSKLHPMVVKLFVDEMGYFTVSNTLRKREVQMGSTAVGLTNITDRFRHITDLVPEFGEKGDQFIARIPLV